jgi:preprotein translocase subunit SecG
MENPANPYSSPAANLYGAASGGGSDAVSPGAIAQLAGTKPWVRFISVMLWIAIGFMILGAIGIGSMMAFGLAQKNTASPFGGMEMIVIAVMYGVLAFMYIYPAVKLWSFANRIGSLGATRSVADLEAALTEQRRFWKFLGIMTIIMICLYFVFIIGMIGFGATAAMKAGAFPR